MRNKIVQIATKSWKWNSKERSNIYGLDENGTLYMLTEVISEKPGAKYVTRWLRLCDSPADDE